MISYTVGRLQLQMLLAEYLLRTGEQRLAARLPRPAALVRNDAVRDLGPELLADLDKPASAVRAAANY